MYNRRRCLPAILVCLGLIAASLMAAHPAQATISNIGPGGCPANTVVGGSNWVLNSDFSAGSTGFTSALTARAPDTYPADSLGGGYSIQTGDKSYPPFDPSPFIIGRGFPGDVQRDVPVTPTYFYSNPSAANYTSGGGQVLLWQQTVGVAPSTTYNFFAYFDNLLDPARSAPDAADPQIQLRVNGIAAGTVTVLKTPDIWLPIQYAFTTGPGVTSVTLSIYSLTNQTIGDDFAMTQINLKQCVTGVGAAKFAYPALSEARGGLPGYRLEYLITVRNLGADPVTSLQVTDDLALFFASAPSWQVVSLGQVAGGGLVALAVNPGFNGQSNKNLLAAGQSLAAGQTGRLRLVIWVQSPAGPTKFSNSVQVSAVSGSIAVGDASSPGLDPDPNMNGDPREEGENRSTEVLLTPLVYRLPIIGR